jgi:hypothetical protein
MTYEHILGMPGVRSQQVTGKQVNGFAAFLTRNGFHPKEVLRVSIFSSARNAAGSMQLPDVLL